MPKSLHLLRHWGQVQPLLSPLFHRLSPFPWHLKTHPAVIIAQLDGFLDVEERVKADATVEEKEVVVDPNISTPVGGVSGVKLAIRKEMKRDELLCLSEERPMDQGTDTTLKWSVII